MDKITTTVPHKMMQGDYPRYVIDVVHLFDKPRRIIMCSYYGSLRLWDLESRKQIGDDWRDDVDKVGAATIALSPNGSTVTSGSDGGTVRLWDVKMGKVIVRWTKHTESVLSVCWSADCNKVMSESLDGMSRIKQSWLQCWPRTCWWQR
jgi:WD40 repeat protein